MRNSNLHDLGYARVYTHPRTGELIVDTDTLRRSRGRFAGDEFGAREDDDVGDDDDFGDDDEEFGARRRRGRSGSRRRDHLEHRADKVERKIEKHDRRHDDEDEDDERGSRRRRRKKRDDDGNGDDDGWGTTAIGGTDKPGEAGPTSVRIRLQHDFRATDITFTGSVAGAKVTSIFFADRSVWSSSDGIPADVFASQGFLRGILKGQHVGAGRDIIVNGLVPAAGDFTVTLIGQKPLVC